MHGRIESLTDPRTLLASLDVAQNRLAAAFNVTPRCLRRWRDGTRRVPRGTQIVLCLMVEGLVSLSQVETESSKCDLSAR